MFRSYVAAGLMALGVFSYSQYAGLSPFAGEPATSWAAPHLAGIAARLLSLRPGLKPFEMKAILYWLAQARQRAAPP